MSALKSSWASEDPFPADGGWFDGAGAGGGGPWGRKAPLLGRCSPCWFAGARPASGTKRAIVVLGGGVETCAEGIDVEGVFGPRWGAEGRAGLGALLEVDTGEG